MRTDEIARILKKKDTTIRSLLSRAREKLKTTLK
ncbi:MAG TPA: RNA polymerase subunit sigma-24, partial [Lachnoclostridium phytofermentans]|nr:RNA polymerase subunit sigma-24 [Lachnoclostridium phytofermentans]